MVERVGDVDADPAGLQALAQTDAPHRLGDRRGAEDDVAGQLRPGGEGDADLDHRRRRLRGGARHVEVAAARAGSCRCASMPASDAASVSPSNPCRIGRSGSRSKRSTSIRPRSLVAISTGSLLALRLFADRRPSCPANRIPRQRHPGRRGSRRSCRSVSPAVNTRTVRYGSSSAIRRAARTALFTPRSSTVAGIRLRLDNSRVSKSASRISPQSPSCHQGVGDDVADAEPDDADPQPTEAALLVGGDQVAVAVQSQGAKSQRAQHAHDRTPPRIVGPAKGLLDEFRCRTGDQSAQTGELFIAPVEEFNARVGTQAIEKSAVAVVRFVEDDRLAGRGIDVQFRASCPVSRT